MSLILSQRNGFGAAGARRRVSSGYDPATDSAVLQWFYAPGNYNASTGTWTASKGTNATQGTSGSRPTVASAALNGKDVVRFDGSDDYVSTTSFAAEFSQPYTIAIVFKQFTTSSGPTIFDGINASKRAQFGNYPSSTFNFYAGSADRSMGSTATTYTSLLFEVNGASSRYRFNGAGWTTLSGTPGANALSGIVLGAAIGGVLPAQCDIAEVLIRTGTIDSTTEASMFDGYIKTGWATW